MPWCRRPGNGDAAGPDGNPCPNDTSAHPGGPARPGASSFVFALPFMEQQPLADIFASVDDRGGIWETNSSQWRTPEVNAALAVRPPMLGCPNDTSAVTVPRGSIRLATGSYAMSAGTLGPDPGGAGIRYQVKTNNTGMFNYIRRRSAAHVRDGLANTFLLGETSHNDSSFTGWNIWTQGGRYVSLRTTGCPPNTTPRRCANAFDYYANTAINGDFSSMHGEGLSFAFADGHTQYISDLIAMEIYQALSTVAGGVIDAGGRFTLTTFEPGDGVMPGRHKVVVNASKALSGGRVQWLVPRSLRSLATTSLELEVTGPTDSARVSISTAAEKPEIEVIDVRGDIPDLGGGQLAGEAGSSRD